MNLILVGYRGSGKSSVGTILARRLGWRFVDLDALIVQRAGRSIADIFAAEGEEGFRRREREACLALRKSKNLVISLGGGTLTDPESRAVVRRLGKVIYLQAPPAVLWSRISHDSGTSRNRPDLTAAGGLGEVEALLAEREPLYRATAHHIVNTLSATPEEIAETIELWFQASDTDTGW